MNKELLKENDIREAAKAVFNKYVEAIKEEFGTGSDNADGYRERANQIIRKAGETKRKRRATWQIVLRKVAILFLVICLSAGSVLVFSEPARAAVLSWFKEFKENYFVYHFEGEDNGKELKVPEFGWLPEGFEKKELQYDDYTYRIKFGNSGKKYIELNCDLIETVDEKALFAPTGIVESIMINGIKGEYYQSDDWTDPNYLIWQDDANNVICLIRSNLDKDNIIKTAENIRFVDESESVDRDLTKTNSEETAAVVSEEEADVITAEDERQISALIDDYYNAVNEGDRKRLISLFGKPHKKFIKNFVGFSKLGDNPEPYDLGKCTELERQEIKYSDLLAIGWSPMDDCAPGYSDFRLYLELYEYKLGDSERIYVDLKEGTHYNYLWVARKNNKWRIISIQKAYDMTSLVENGLIQYEETTEGTMSTLDAQLFGERLNKEATLESGNSKFTENNGFFRCFYSNPKEIDFEEFMKDFPIRAAVKSPSKEYEEVNELMIKELGAGFGDSREVPIWRYKKEDVDKVLKKYADITTADLDFNNSENLLYSEKYDSYYNFSSDAGAGTFEPDSGFIRDDIYTLKETDKLELIKEGDDYISGHYTIVTRFRRVGDEYKIISRELEDQE